MEFLLSDDDREVVKFARSALRGVAGLPRLRDRATEWSVWPTVAADGWFDAGPSGEVALPVLASIAREAGKIAAVDQFVDNGWLLPSLLGHVTDLSTRAHWLQRARERPGAVSGVGLGGTRQGPLAFGVGPGYDLYTISEDVDAVRISRTGHDSTAFAPLAGLSFGVASPTTADDTGVQVEVTLPQADRDAVLRAARILHAAGSVGIAGELIARTVEHVGSRHQFGHPLGRFQAIKHTCADAYTETEVAWLAVLYAAASDDVEDAVDKAAILSARALATAARISSQFHGAMGFTWESDLHLLLKAALDARLRFTEANAAARRTGRRLVEAS